MQQSVDLNTLLKGVIEKKASDLHLIAGAPPMQRLSTQLARVNTEVLTPEATKLLIEGILSPAQKARFEKEKELDLSYTLGEVSRFRVNIHLQRGSYAAAFRVIPTRIPNLADLSIPKIVGDF